MTIDGQCVKRKKIWVICEGKHESGGALLNLIHRILPSAVESEIIFEPWKNPRNSGRRFRSSGKGDGVFKKFIAAIFDAQRDGFDCVVGLIDCDSDRSRIRSVDKAQEDDRIDFPRAFGVAIETFDAWFLADEVALSTCFGIQIQSQPDPESCEDAKAVITKFQNSGTTTEALADCYAILASIAKLEQIERRCPKSFGVWMKRVAAL